MASEDADLGGGRKGEEADCFVVRAGAKMERVGGPGEGGDAGEVGVEGGFVGAS